MKKNKMEVKIFIDLITLLHSVESVFKIQRKSKENSSATSKVKNQVRKIQKALNSQIMCAFPVIYDMKPSRGDGDTCSLVPLK